MQYELYISAFVFSQCLSVPMLTVERVSLMIELLFAPWLETN